jgi:hypothetical protein
LDDDVAEVFLVTAGSGIGPGVIVAEEARVNPVVETL